MLNDLFVQILDMTMTGSFVILAVLLFRLLLKKAPKVISYALWTAVLLRLLVPFHIEAPVSIVPEMDPVQEHYSLAGEQVSFAGAGEVAYQAAEQVFSGEPVTQRLPAAQITPEGEQEYVQVDLLDICILLGQYVWITGVAVLGIYSILSYIRLKRKLRVRVLLRENIYLADDIQSPFVMGIFQPEIYLPAGLREREQEFIILHERHHIQRWDPLWKALGFVALMLHWFNPLVWLAFIQAGKDMEMSCDEAVIRKLGEDVRADYSASLLNLATGKRVLTGMPLAFGEGDTKSSIKNLARWKKPILWITVAAAILCAVLTVCLLTDPTGTEQPDQNTESATATTVPQQMQQNESTVPTTDPQHTSPPETTSPVITGPGSDINFNMGALDTKFPFVFDENDEWLMEYLGYFSHFMDVSELNPGGCYVVEKRENKLLTMLEGGVRIIRETPSTVFCVTEDNRVIRCDYDGEKTETVYEATYGTITAAERLNEYMCLVEGDYVVCLNLITYQVEAVYSCEGVEYAYYHKLTQLLWRTDKDYYLIDTTTGKQQALTEKELNNLLYGIEPPEDFTDPTEPTVPDDFEIPDGIPGVVTYSKKLEELPQSYTPQQAAADGCVVMVDGDVSANESIWTAYTGAYSRGESIKVRLAEYDASGSVKRLYELVGSQYGHLYRLLENGIVSEKLYSYLAIDGDGDYDGGHYNMFWVYALTNDGMWKFRKGVPYDDSTWGNDAVMAYCNLYMRYEHPPIPEKLMKAEVILDGKTVAVIWNQQKLGEIQAFLSTAEGYMDWPKTVVMGYTLVFTGTDGTVVEAGMMRYSPMVEIDGVFYNYDPGWRDNKTVEDLIDLLGVDQLTG